MKSKEYPGRHFGELINETSCLYKYSTWRRGREAVIPLRYPTACMSYIFLLCMVQIKCVLSKHTFYGEVNTWKLDRGEFLPNELIVEHRGVKLDNTGDSVGSSLIVQLSRDLVVWRSKVDKDVISIDQESSLNLSLVIFENLYNRVVINTGFGGRKTRFWVLSLKLTTCMIWVEWLKHR